MARIAFGLGTSHGPMLSTPPEVWPERVKADRAKPAHDYNGKRYTFDELVELRKDEKLAEQITPEVCRERHARCQHAIARLADIFQDNRPDIAVIIGNDQMEVFTRDHVPAFAIFHGDYVEDSPRTPEFLAKLPPGIADAELDRTPPVYTKYPCLPGLGRHLIEKMTAERFDVAQLTRLTVGERGSNTVPHAYAFIYRRVMRDRVVPHTPVFVNTFFKPNQPRAGRCFKFGSMLAQAIMSWPSDQTVAVFASGGLTHYVINEPFDRIVIDALRDGDSATLSSLSENMLQAGTSEIKNWITVAGMMTEAGLKMKLIDYVPCYRSEAGTGNAMAFAHWY